MKAKEILQAALDSFGPAGEGWCKGYSNEDKKACAVHACWKVRNTDDYGSGFQDACSLLNKALPAPAESTVQFNDSPETNFADVKEWFGRAIAAA